MKRLLAALSFLCLSAAASATPSVTSVSGSVSYGSTLSFTVTGAGTKPVQQKTYFFANFEDSSAGVAGTTWAVTSTMGDISNVSRVTTNCLEGNGCAGRGSTTMDSNNNNTASVTHTDVGYGGKLMASWDWWLTGSPIDVTGNFKAYRWYAGSFLKNNLYGAQQVDGGFVNYVENNDGILPDNSTNRFYSVRVEPEFNAHEQAEIRMHRNSTGNATDGELYIEQDRAAAVSNTTFQSNTTGDTAANGGYTLMFPIHMVWTGVGSFNADNNFRYDNVIVDTSWCQVWVTTAPTNGAGGTKYWLVVQTWADTSITAVLGQNFTTGSQLYAYVRENGGTVNSTGYPLTFGTTASAPTGSGYVRNLGYAVDSTATTGTANKVVITLTNTVAAGQTIIVRCASEYTSAATTITDAKGNTYTSLRTAGTAGATAGTYDGSGNILTAPVGNRCSTFWCPSLATQLVSGDTITVQFTSGLSTTLREKVAVADQFTGLAGTLDTSTGLNGTGAGFGSGLGDGNTGIVGSGFTSTANNCLILHEIFTQQVDAATIEIAPSVDQLTQKGVTTAVNNPVRICAGWKWAAVSGSYPINFKVASAVKWQVQSFSFPLASAVTEARSYVTLANVFGPVAFYRFDEASGVFADSTRGSGASFDGVAHGTVSRQAASPIASIPNGAIKFNGSSGNYVEIPDATALSAAATGSLTICAWIRPDSLQNTVTEGSDPEGSYVHFLGKAVASPAAYEYMMRLYNKFQADGVTLNQRPNRLSIYHFKTTGGLGSGSYFQDNLTVGGWIFVAASFNAIGPAIWKDGAWRDGDFFSDYGITPADTTSPLRVGTAALTSYVNAAIGPLVIFPRRLTDEEVYRLYVASVNGGTSSSAGAGGSGSSAAVSTTGAFPWITP